MGCRISTIHLTATAAPVSDGCSTCSKTTLSRFSGAVEDYTNNGNHCSLCVRMRQHY